MVVNKGDQREAERHDRAGGGRFEPGDKAHQVADQDEQKEHGQVGTEALVAVADNAFALLTDEAVNHLREVLHAAGRLDRERGSNGDEVQQQCEEDEQFHRDGVGDGRARILGNNMQRRAAGCRPDRRSGRSESE